MKQTWRAGTMLNPVPAVLVSCAAGGRSNLLTVAWAGTICSDPAMLSISVRPERFSHALIKDSMEFTVNLTTAAMARATDWCGVRSDRDGDKWQGSGLTPAPGVGVSCPCVDESPVCIECRVRQIVPLGTHDMFLGEVVDVLADDRCIDPATGKLDLAAAGLITYCHGAYYTLGEYLGHFGFSVRKK